MSTLLYRKYIDIINENSLPLDETQLEEGKIARILGALGLAAIAGIGGQHAAMTDPNTLVKSPEFTQKLTQELDRNPEFQKYMSNYLKYADSASQETNPEFKKFDNKLAFDYSKEAGAIEDKTANDILKQLQSQQPTLWNKIKNTVSMNEQKNVRFHAKGR